MHMKLKAEILSEFTFIIAQLLSFGLLTMSLGPPQDPAFIFLSGMTLPKTQVAYLTH